jgi:hypothetical protein
MEKVQEGYPIRPSDFAMLVKRDENIRGRPKPETLKSRGRSTP